jgi:hypothetical protein
MNHSMRSIIAIVSKSPRNALSRSIGQPHIACAWAFLAHAHVEITTIVFAELDALRDLSVMHEYVRPAIARDNEAPACVVLEKLYE